MEEIHRSRQFGHPAAWLFALVVVCATGAPLVMADEAPQASSSLTRFPERIPLERSIFGSDGKPLSGRHAITLSYFDLSGNRLFVEQLPAVDITDGSLAVEMGSGAAESRAVYPSLQVVFATHPELELEVAVDGQPQSPRIGILPAGHSLKTALVARGVREADDDEAHWSHYETASSDSATQAAVLNPAGPPRTAATQAGQQSYNRRPFLVPMSGPFLSRPVRDLPVVRGPSGKVPAEVNRPRQEILLDDRGRPFGTVGRRDNDALAIESEVLVPMLSTPSLSLSFEGIANINGVLPPDTEGAVGPNHYLQVVNLSFAVFDKAGTLLHGPVNTNTLWSGFGGLCQSQNSGDAIFAYDEAADRWVLSQFAIQSNSVHRVCFAVSQTGDPLGAYYLYEASTPRFPDYFKLGVWPDTQNNAYFMGTNSGSQFQYDVFALDRASMIAGAPARPMQLFQSFSNLMMPADLDAWNGGAGAPPAGSPGLFYTIRDGGEPYFGSPATDSIDVWAFQVDWNTPANTTFTLIESITPADGLAPFNWTLCGFFESGCPTGNAIPQPGTAQKLDSASWWPMQRLVYQNYGPYQSLFGTWTVDAVSSGDRAAPRWFELRSTGVGWYIEDQGTHSPDAIHRWMPSIAADVSGNIALGYSRGDASNYASVYYAARETTDPPGTLQAEALLHAGTGAQTNSSGRWGDYAAMDLDPADGCTFWFTTEYLQSTGSAPWRTRVGTFSLPSCGDPRFALGCTPNSLQVNVGESDTSACNIESLAGYADTVTLSCTGLPAGMSCDFDTNSITAPYASGLTVNTTSAAPTGITAFVVEATDGVATRSAPMSIAVYPPGANGPQVAEYNAGLGAPLCSVAGNQCDSAGLLNGRASLGPEPNQPNTIDSCTDGGSGTYHGDESNDRLVVRHIDGVSNLVEGATVEVEATVFSWSNGSLDRLDLYYTANANSPSWVLIGTLAPPGGGTQVLTAQYTLPTGSLQAVRANFRYRGSPSPCSGGVYDDADDLVFTVDSSVECTVDADCDNGLYCDGGETCNAGVCQSGTAPVCSDGLYCNGTETCNEATDSCAAGTAPVCDNGLFCDGAESCNEATDQCNPGTAVTCSDGTFCNGVETCNEATDSCDAGVPPDCSDGLFCNGLETCDSNTDACVGGTPPEPDDGVACTVDSCDEVLDVLVNTPSDALCDDATFCNGAEVCNALTGCEAGSPVCADAGQSCDEVNDVCTSSACDNDGLCEAGESCGTCPNDCISGTSSGAACGNGVCEAADGENASLCPADCNGIVSGRPANRFSCGFNDSSNNNSVGCSDPRCTSGGWQCTEAPAPTGSYCCGDDVCSGDETWSSCSLDCGAGPVCGNGIVELGEICDGADLNGESCDNLGFSGGTLSCAASCQEYDTSLCGPPQCVFTSNERIKSRNGAALCSDGIDNDCDGLIDLADPGCN